MKKTLLSLAMLLIGVGAWAQEYDLTTFDVTTNEASPITYVMESRRPRFAYPDWFFDNGKIKMQQPEDYADKEGLEKNNFLFYFTQGSDENKYYIHPYNAEDGYVLGVASAAANQEIIVVNKNDAGTNIAIEWELGELIDGSVTRKYFKTTIDETVYCMQDNGSGNYVKLASDADKSFVSTALNFGQCDPYTKSNEELKTELQALIDLASTIESGMVVGTYTAESVTTLRTAITTAEEKLSGTVTEEDVENLQNALDALEINQPESGKLYRFKSKVSEKYITAPANPSSTGTAMNLDATLSKRNVIYLEGSNLLCYSSGYYINGSNHAHRGYKGTYSFEASKTYTYGCVSIKVGDNYLSAAPESTSLAQAAVSNSDALDWYIEEVEFLPVSINAEVGYATLYVPVALNNSFEDTQRVVAYTGVANGNVLSLTRVDEEDGVIPANTPVVIEYKNDIQTDGCVYLEVSSSEKAAVESGLKGTFNTAIVTGKSYVLANVEGVTGFYQAELNQSGETGFINNGFKAYLPAAEASARFLNFDFGTETAIESIQGAENGAVIYDLAGRRVQNAQKGLYIVNGKKVIK